MANWTANPYINALLMGSKWDHSNLTYYLDPSAGTWTATEVAAIQSALASWSAVANLTFTRVFSAGAADLVETHFTSSPGSLGVHDVIPGYTSATIIAHDVQLTGSYNLNGYGWDENIAGGGLSV
ncbi:MAG: matrixin family metalloprotease, partial [Beijerinckiaceae bacterium]